MEAHFSPAHLCTFAGEKGRGGVSSGHLPTYSCLGGSAYMCRYTSRIGSAVHEEKEEEEEEGQD